MWPLSIKQQFRYHSLLFFALNRPHYCLLIFNTYLIPRQSLNFMVLKIIENHYLREGCLSVCFSGLCVCVCVCVCVWVGGWMGVWMCNINWYFLISLALSKLIAGLLKQIINMSRVTLNEHCWSLSLAVRFFYTCSH